MSTQKLTQSEIARASTVISVAYLILSNLLLWNHATFFAIVIYVIPVSLILLSSFRKTPVKASYQFSYILLSGIGVWGHDFGLILFGLGLFLFGKLIRAFR